MKEYLNVFASPVYMSKSGKSRKPRSFLGKVWYFIWEDESLLSWLVNIVLAFLLIRFIFYPLVGLVMGTSFPIVAVVSSSMTHTNGDDWLNNTAYCPQICTQADWYSKMNISVSEFDNFSFRSGFNKGDIIFVRGVDPYSIRVGDVIIFNAGKSYPIIHRVVNIYEKNGDLYFETKGDNNPGQIIDPQLNEKAVSASSVIGVGMGRLPYFGYLKIFVSNIIGGVSSR